MENSVDNIRAILVPLGFIAFLAIAADLLVEFITNEPILAAEGIRYAMIGIFLLAIIGVLYVLNNERK